MVDNQYTFRKLTRQQTPEEEDSTSEGTKNKMYRLGKGGRSCATLNLEHSQGQQLALPYMHMKLRHFCPKQGIILQSTTGITAWIQGKNMQKLADNIATFRLEYIREAGHGDYENDFDIFIDSITIHGVDIEAIVKQLHDK